jgi:hypothetical protein
MKIQTLARCSAYNFDIFSIEVEFMDNIILLNEYTNLIHGLIIFRGNRLWTIIMLTQGITAMANIVYI